ncbi:MAG: hypothetical protein Q9168_007090 [Polycauliona sp. 1 TL-2023]
MGAAGLKKFAQAGVDIHTLLCMGEIAETCPARPEYRRELNNCRQLQRKQSIWLYKLVEIGTASNFVADELLKRRAGENIIALMSTVLPILPEQDCDNFILQLFEARKVSFDKTPGFGQLQAFRDTILPLARKSMFKDKVYQNHLLFQRFQPGVLQQITAGIPSVETFVKLVLLFAKLMEDSKYVLSYRGWQGSAWVVAYTRHVLGLPVCVMRTPQDLMPINGQYQTSRVFVYIYESYPIEGKCELLLGGVIVDVIVPATLGAVSLDDWMLDLDNVNLHDLHLPLGAQYDPAIPGITRYLTSIFITQLVKRLTMHPNINNSQEGKRLGSYYEYCLPQILRRASKVLNVMGFQSSDADMFTNHWGAHLEIKIREEISQSMSPSVAISPGPTWLGLALAEKSLVDYNNPDEELLYMYDEESYLRFTDKGQSIICSMLWIADMASWLAMSDWAVTLRALSIEAVEIGRLALHCPIRRDGKSLSSHFASSDSWQAFGDCVRYEFCQSRLRVTTQDIQRRLKYLVMGGPIPRQQTVPERSVTIATESRGIVMTLAAAERFSIDFDALSFKFYQGHIMLFGEKRATIEQNGPVLPGSVFRLTGEVPMRPLNAFSDLQISPELQLCRTSINISYRVLVPNQDGNQVYYVLGPTFSDDNWFTAYVTSNCPDDYDATVPETETLNKKVSMGLDLVRGLHNGSHQETRFDTPIFVAAVDQNPAGQWVSVHGRTSLNSSDERHNATASYVLQRNMCTQCTIECITDFWNKNLDGGVLSKWYIVPTRQQAEDME